MNKEIKEILELAKQLEDASNYKLADSLSASLVKLSQFAGAPTLKPLPTRPIITEPLAPILEPVVAPTPKSSTSNVNCIGRVSCFQRPGTNLLCR